MAQSIVMPSLGMYTAEGTLVSWLAVSGAGVKAGQVIAEIETEKAVNELLAPTDGVLHQSATIGTRLKEEALIGYILAPGETPPGTEAGPQAPAATEATPPVIASDTTPPSDFVKASPLAKKLAAEHAIDLTRLTGTGPGGRIVETDVVRAIEQKSAGAPTAAVDTRPAVKQRVPLTGMRRAISARLRQSVETAVSLTLTREVEADLLVAARQAVSATTPAPVQFDVFFASMLATALRARPEFNSSIEGEELVVYQDINVGIAVSLAEGLVVPVLRNVDQRPLRDLSAEFRNLAARAREGALRSDEQIGGTCTLTNLGAGGIDAFTPVLNPPQSCILGIGRIMPRAVARDGALVLAHTCVLSLTFDHRVADGAPAAELLGTIARLMNDSAYLDSLTKPA